MAEIGALIISGYVLQCLVVLEVAGMELVFFVTLQVLTVLCFGFVTKLTLVTHQCFGYCTCSVKAFCFSYSAHIPCSK